MNAILKINDINLEKIWGQKKIDNKIIGEIIKFEINKERSNTVSDNLGNSYNLYELYTGPKKEKIFGEKYLDVDKFPFLIKYIYSSQKLSIQNHPIEKKETWLFLKDNSKILIGLKNKLEKEALSVDKLLNNVNIIDMPKYSFAVIEPGTIHSIFENNAICEVQNNCDVTYRYYDWDNNRKLTREEFIENGDFNKYDLKKNVWHNFKEYKSDKFNMEKIDIINNKIFSKLSYCQVLIVLEGNGILKTSSDTLNLKSEESYLIGANTEYTITGNVSILLVS